MRTPEEYAGLFSRLTFRWLDPLMKTGYSKPLEQEDFYKILKRDESVILAEKFAKAWQVCCFLKTNVFTRLLQEVVEEKEKYEKKIQASKEQEFGEDYQRLAGHDDEEKDCKEDGDKGDLMPVLRALHRAGILDPFYEGKWINMNRIH